MPHANQSGTNAPAIARKMRRAITTLLGENFLLNIFRPVSLLKIDSPIHSKHSEIGIPVYESKWTILLDQPASEGKCKEVSTPNRHSQILGHQLRIVHLALSSLCWFETFLVASSLRAWHRLLFARHNSRPDHGTYANPCFPGSRHSCKIQCSRTGSNYASFQASESCTRHCSAPETSLARKIHKK